MFFHFLLGSHCEVDIDECLHSPCVHGTCTDQVNGFKCHCSPGYAGFKCDYNLKECLSNPCQNGGSCIDEVGGYRCDCGLGYRGDHCQIDIDLCQEPMMCINSISCQDKGHSVKCFCKAGFTGYNCAVNINDCLSYPCKNGGICRDKVNDFECICPHGFSGKTCKGSTEATSVKHFERQFSLKLMTEDCKLLKDSQDIIHINQGIASNMAKSCSCSFDEGNIVNESVILQCRDSISAEVSMEIKPVKEKSVSELICQFYILLNQSKNVIDLGYNSYAVRVLSDVSACGAINVTDKGTVQDSNTQEDEDTSSSGNIAVTVSSTCAALGLIAAAVVVCLKCRRAIPPSGKKSSSKGENQLIEDLSADLLTAVAPTPKSMYRTSGGYHNMAYSGRFNPENPVKSRRV